MKQLMTTREVADYIRIKERKVYDLLRKKRIPATRITGKWLFPKTLIDHWIASSTKIPGAFKNAVHEGKATPAICAGSQDPLLEWSLRESECQLALMPGGSLDGLERLSAGEAMLSGLHVYEPISETYNQAAVIRYCPSIDVVLIEWAKRERGLIFKENNNIKNISIENYKGKRLVRRQIGSGSEIYLQYILRTYNLSHDDFKKTEIAYSENDAVHLVLSDKADVTLGLKSEAKKYQLGFCPIITERFDLVVDRKFWFEKPFQDLLNFCKTSHFKEIASNLDGYNIIDLVKVHFNSN